MTDQIFRRSSGVLLHPTSLPGPYGAGDLGEWAYRFVDILAAAKQTLWQVLPLGPTGFGESPYQSLSSFAGNTNLISLGELLKVGWLNEDDLADLPPFSERKVDYQAVMLHHDELLSVAYDRFEGLSDPAPRQEFETWCARNAYWLDDFALYVALKEMHGLQTWTVWPQEEAFRNPTVLEAANGIHASRIAEHRFRQWVFDWQWQALKAYANGKGIRIIGDVPIFTAHDSSDVWANPDLFFLDSYGNPPIVTGVPPDSFNPTGGQRWGHPVYRWTDVEPRPGKTIKEKLYDWWVSRIRKTLEMVDIVRIDHFRAFYDYFEVPASDQVTTRAGRWVPGPQKEFFDAVRAALGDDLPIIAEDLGDRMEKPIQLRLQLGLPGMAILQFAFSGTEAEQERFRPDRIPQDTVVYTGTHDNNTSLGWWRSEASDHARRSFLRYLGVDHVAEPNWEMIRLGMQSPAHSFLVPMQDILGLGASARLNRPGVPSGNWRWRCTAKELESAPWDRLRKLTEPNTGVKTNQFQGERGGAIQAAWVALRFTFRNIYFPEFRLIIP